ncbi:hypothetical protein K0651_03855 [Ornithinimicrobium sp. Arc0846-15]|nr:hypothetical protein [Ornithinimicrobium laminariae]
MGGVASGFVLYVQDGKPTYHYNYFGVTRTIITSSTELPDGESKVTFEFLYDGGGGGKGGEAVLFH